MKKYLSIFLFIVLSGACSGKYAGMGQPAERFPDYCSLINVSFEVRNKGESKPFLGITYSLSGLHDRTPVNPCRRSVKVESVVAGSPAAEAGLQEDDIILSVDGEHPCREGDDVLTSFRKLVQMRDAGSPLTLEILRNGAISEITAYTEVLPAWERQSAAHNTGVPCPIGISLLEEELLRNEAIHRFMNVAAGLNDQLYAVHRNDYRLSGIRDYSHLNNNIAFLRNPLQAGEIAREISQELRHGIEDQVSIYDTVRRVARLLDLDLKDAHAPEEITLSGLIETLVEANRSIEDALKLLSEEEKLFFRSHVLESAADGIQMPEIVEIMQKIDFKALIESLTPLLLFFTEENLSALKKDILQKAGNTHEPILYEEVTPAGRVIVGGNGPNIYREDAALILDLGGNDLYLNNAGGTRPGMNVALVIDWSGNDVYQSRDNFSQAAGIMGGGILIDLAGSDIFTSREGSQGAGFMGLGFLFHAGERAFFSARGFCQGVGNMGLGIMVNGSGDDVYSCSRYGQALGLFRGAGVLLDKSGDDYYLLGGLEQDFRDSLNATVSLGQGFGKGMRPGRHGHGLPGGIGILLDVSGDDAYVADYFAQGASYYHGAGILNDLAGNDRYSSGRYAQGAGIHMSTGVLLDHEGDDFYFASFGVAQGAGHDFGVGFIEDGKGDDLYYGGILVQGAATPGSVGVIVDAQGKDYYSCAKSCQAHSENEDGIGIMIDGYPDLDFLSQHNTSQNVRLGIK